MNFNPMNIFASNPAVPQPTAPVPGQPPQVAPVQPANTSIPVQPTIAPAEGPNTAPNGVVPADPNAPPGTEPNDQNADKSPLAGFTELWQTKPVDPNAPAPTDPLAIDTEQLQEHIGKINFAETVSPEILAKITAGGEEAAGAFLEAMNTVARQVLTQSTLVSNKLAQRVTAHEAQGFQDNMLNLIKQNQVTQNLGEANPLFNHPAVKPVIDSVKEQLSIKHPTATPGELTTMAQDFITAMSSSFNPQAPTVTPQQLAEFPDFDKFMTG